MDEAISIATYLINRLPTPILQNFTPYDKLHTIKLDYSFFKSFGCLCYPHLRAYTTNKLMSKSKRCIFLRYSSSHLGYCCLSLTTSKLFISCDVIFYEHIFPFENSVDIPPPSKPSDGILESASITFGATHLSVPHTHIPFSTMTKSTHPNTITHNFPSIPCFPTTSSTPNITPISNIHSSDNDLS